jgi:hypothetical protein
VFTAFRRLVPRRVRLLLLAATLVVAAVVAWPALSESPLDVRAYHRVRLGMTLAEAEAALGAAVGQCTTATRTGFATQELAGWFVPDPNGTTVRETGPLAYDIVSTATGEVVGHYQGWCDGRYRVDVVVRDGRVVYKTHSRVVPAYEIVFGRLRRWLGL